MYLTTAQVALWLAVIIGEVAVIALIFLRRAYRLFPVFALYAGFAASTSLVLFLALYTVDLRVYFWGYLAVSLMSATAKVGCLYELLSSLFASRNVVPKFGCTLSILVLGCLAISFRVFPSAYSSWMGVFRGFEQAVGWFLLLAFVVVWARVLTWGIPIRNRARGIAAGFLMLAIGDVVFGSIAPHVPSLAPWLRYVPMSAYLCAEVLWLRAFLQQEPKRFCFSVQQVAPLVNNIEIRRAA